MPDQGVVCVFQCYPAKFSDLAGDFVLWRCNVTTKHPAFADVVERDTVEI